MKLKKQPIAMPQIKNDFLSLMPTSFLFLYLEPKIATLQSKNLKINSLKAEVSMPTEESLFLGIETFLQFAYQKLPLTENTEPMGILEAYGHAQSKIEEINRKALMT